MAKIEIDKRVVVISLVSLVVAVIIIWMIVERNNKEDYCVCTSRQGGRSSFCSDSLKMEGLYLKGYNETMDFGKIKRKWDTISPGDYDFPKREVCDE